MAINHIEEIKDVSSVEYIQKKLSDEGCKIALLANKDKIYKFYTKSFSSSYTSVSSEFDNISLATGFYRKIVERICSALFAKFPQSNVDEHDVREVLENNKDLLEALFFKAIKHYVLYGAVVIVYDNEELKILEDFEELSAYDDILVINKGISSADEEIIKSIELDLDCSKGGEFIYYKGKRYLKIDGDKTSFVELPDTDTSYSLCLYDSAPFVSYVLDIFKQIEDIYSSYIKTHEQIKTIALYDASLTEEAKKRLLSDLKAIPIVANKLANVKEIGDLVQFVDNSPVAATLQLQSNQIQQLKQEIIDILDLQDLFVGAVQDNPNETRVAAENRVSVSRIVWSAKQKRVNNFIENCCKFLISKILGRNVEFLGLELDSVSVLQQEMEEVKKEAVLQKIIGLMQIASNSSPYLANFYYTLVEGIADKAGLSNNLLGALKGIKQEQDMLRQQAEINMQNQEITPDTQKILAEIDKIKAETLKITEDAKKSAVEAEAVPLNTQAKVLDETQQYIDAQRRAKNNGLDIESIVNEVNNNG